MSLPLFFKKNLPLLIGFFLSSFWVFLNLHNSFFWDTVQLGSKHANFYFTTHFTHILLPNEIDSGHIPFFGMYLAFIWKLFGRELWISHLSLLPFVIGIVYQLFLLVKKFIPEKYHFVAFFLVLLDPTLLSQMTLISPDVLLLFFFLLGVNAVFNKQALLVSIAIVFLFLTSMRGMMVALCILFLDLYTSHLNWRNGKIIIPQLLNKSLVYLPAVFVLVFYSVIHFQEKGWIGFHKDSPWSECFAPVNFKGFLYNIGILIWRLIDFGRIGVWIVFGISIILYRKSFRRDPKIRILLLFFSCFLVVLPANMLWAKNLLAHRYLLPIYIIFSLLSAALLFSEYVKANHKNFLSAFWAIILISGNFWIYPSKISQGWDASPAHIPYYKLRLEAIRYLDTHNIELCKVASFFPNEARLDEIDLSGDNRRFSIYDGENKYVLYSNVYNVGDNVLAELKQNYEVIQQFEKHRISIQLLSKKENSIP